MAYFAASVDPPDVNRAFAEALNVDFPLLSDPSADVARAYGVVDDDQPFASRWTFYIDRDGRIASIDKNVDTAKHGLAIVTQLAEMGVRRR